MPELVPLVVGLSNGRQATLSPSPAPERVHVRISPNPQTPAGFPGSLEFVEGAWNSASSRARDALEAAAGLAAGEAIVIQLAFDAHVVAFHAAEDAAARVHQQVADNGPTVDITQRLMHQPASDGLHIVNQTVHDVMRLLQREGMAPDTVIEWDKATVDRLCILDVDFHNDTAAKPTHQDIDTLGNELSPAPWLWWRSHGGGLKALYGVIPHAPFSALELAAGAAAQVACTPFVVRCKGTVELLSRTRHPTSLRKHDRCGPIHDVGATDEFACLHRFSHADATVSEIDEILDLKGFTVGDKLSHDHCIIDPGHVSKSPFPVMVGENGLYCFSCAGHGDIGRGFRSWGSVRRSAGLLVSRTDAGGLPIVKAAQHFVHADHARYLFKTLAPEIPIDYQTPLYSALLKRLHGDDPRIPMAFTTFGFVRGEGEWLHADTLKFAAPLTKDGISVLPSVRIQNPDPEGDEPTKLATPLCTLHLNNGNLPGWMPIVANLFVPVFAVHNDLPASQHRAICKPNLILDGRPHVTYLPADKRIPKSLAIDRIVEYFPGISIPYLMALLVSMGSAECGEGMAPIIWASGPTGAGKTTTARIILEMFGEDFQSLSGIEYDKLNEVFGEALEQSRVVMFDDFAKEPKTYRQWHTFFLQVNRKHTFRKLYVGKKDVPIRSALILADRELPEFFRTSPQFGRRVHHIRLDPLPMSWEVLGHRVERWWQRTPELTEAAESFYSWMVDEFFPAGDDESFNAKMTKIGIHLLGAEQTAEVEKDGAISEILTRLVMAICEADPLNPADERRIGKGYREVIFGSQSVIGKACTDLIEDQGPVPQDKEHLEYALDRFQQTMKHRFGLQAQARLEIALYGRRTYIRLVQDGVSTLSRSKLVNRELFPVWPADPTLFKHEAPQTVPVNGHNGYTNGHNGHANGHNGHSLAPTMSLGSVDAYLATPATSEQPREHPPTPPAWLALFAPQPPKAP